jgi:hypothetical protein
MKRKVLIIAFVALNASTAMASEHHHRHGAHTHGRAVAAAQEDRRYPDRTKTPGDVLAVTASDVCVRGYSKKVRDVPIEVKKDVYSEYGVTYVRGQDEVDHLVSLELGGSNRVKNLWPEPYNDRSGWSARVKDAEEDKLHELVCSGKLPLKEAQHDIATDWIAAYRRDVGPIPHPQR